MIPVSNLALAKRAPLPVGFSNYATYANNCGACHGLKLEGSDQAPALTGVLDRMAYGEMIELINKGKGRMPGFAFLDDIERRGIVRYMLSPEPVEDAPSTEDEPPMSLEERVELVEEQVADLIRNQ